MNISPGKLFSSAANRAAAFCIGCFWGALSAVVILLLFFQDTFSAFQLVLIFFAPVLICGFLFLYLEIKKTDNKIIRFFQGSIIKKSTILLAAYFFIRFALMLDSAVHKHIYGKYELFADELAKTVSDSIYSGDMTPEIDNRLKIDYVLVTEAYSLTEENLLKTGKVSAKLAKAMATANAQTDGTYLHIAKKDKLMAVKSFKAAIDVADGFQLVRAGDKIRFYVRREIKKDKFGKKFEEFVIYGLE